MKNRKKTYLEIKMGKLGKMIPNWIKVVVGGFLMIPCSFILVAGLFGQILDPYPTKTEYMESIGVGAEESNYQIWLETNEVEFFEETGWMKPRETSRSIPMLNLRSFPDIEVAIILDVAMEYDMSEHETALLFSIRKVENGRPGLEFGCGDGINDHPARRYAGDFNESLRLQAMWCAGTIKKRYRGNIKKFSEIYCSENSINWERMITSWMDKIS